MQPAFAIHVAIEPWPIAGIFALSRGSRTVAEVVVATVTRDGVSGRGECVPYARYGETVEGVAAALRALDGEIVDPLDAARGLKPGAALNALDCALWDWRAKRSGRPVWMLAGLAAPRPVTTAFTISLGSPEAMAVAARAAAARPLLKVKLGGEGDPERIEAVRAAAPAATLIADANEAWTEATIQDALEACRRAQVALIEQPVPAGQEALLAPIRGVLPLCADESLHTLNDLPAVARHYDAVNVKLDKAGGLTGALALTRAARAQGLQVMVGCMVGTSLAMAPALLLAGEAAYVDLDGPLLLAHDRTPGLLYRDSLVHPPEPALWG